MTGNEDLTVQFGEDPPWDDLPPVDREKANKELESRLIFDSWTCRFCGGTFADRTLAIKHAIDCDDCNLQDLCLPFVKTECSFADDTHFVILKEKALKKLGEK